MCYPVCSPDSCHFISTCAKTWQCERFYFHLQLKIDMQVFRGVCEYKKVIAGPWKVLKKICFMKFRVINILNGVIKVLILILRGLQFGFGKTRITIQYNVIIKLKNIYIMIELNKWESCMFLK